jgi:hypothetical protein
MSAKGLKKRFTNGNASLSTHVSSYGATVYLNRDALKLLIDELQRISDAEPKECYEIHVSRYFSYFDERELFVVPPVKYAAGLEEIFEAIFDKDVESERDLRTPAERVARTPFEVTIMHVSDEALERDANENNPIEGPVSWTLSAGRNSDLRGE